MKRLYIAFIGLLLVGGLVGIVYFGIQPRPIPKIKLSHFENETVIANSVLLRLGGEIQAAPLLLIGLDPEQEQIFSVVEGFVNQLQASSRKFDHVIVDSHLVRLPQILNSESLDLRSLYSGLPDLSRRQRIIVVTHVDHASGLIKSQLVDYLRSQGVHPTSFLFLDYPVSRENEKLLPYRCHSDVADVTGRGRLDCIILQLSRSTYLKQKPTPNGFSGLVNQIGATEYLLLFHK